jgi:hypothetical protein
MSRTAWVFAAGLTAALLGVVLVLGAHGLATHWESSGNGVSVGTTDPGQVFAYRAIGIALLVFGLGLETLAFWRWMVGRDVPLARRP